LPWNDEPLAPETNLLKDELEKAEMDLVSVNLRANCWKCNRSAHA